MKLNEYPEAIAGLETKILAMCCELEIQQELLSFMDAEVEEAIASDNTLKNEQQRKAKRLELQQQPDYLGAKTQLKEVKEQRERLTIKLNLTRNEFSVAKIEARLMIAQTEAAA